MMDIFMIQILAIIGILVIAVVAERIFERVLCRRFGRDYDDINELLRKEKKKKKAQRKCRQKTVTKDKTWNW